MAGKAKRASLASLRGELRRHATPARAKASAWYFKTGPGQYAEGDIFIGVTVPATRRLARQGAALPLPDIQKLLASKIHEERLLALIILVGKAERAAPQELKKLYRFYLRNLRHVNNWDLVDSSAGQIAGAYLYEHPDKKKILYRLARSGRLWDRRVAVLSTSYFIGKGQFTDALRVTGMLLGDEEDLLHKACGWMLREIGKRDQKVLEAFLKKNHRKMPRTMLRYAIERFPEKKRRAYLEGKI
ncbi:MAG: DNA alkylation repair protein [Bdellovibrionota bacterium]